MRLLLVIGATIVAILALVLFQVDRSEIQHHTTSSTTTTSSSTITASTTKIAGSSTSNYNNKHKTLSSTPFSQEEEEIRRLQTSGALNHVAGETSLLSQEILDISQPEYESAPALSQMNPTKMGLLTTHEGPSSQSQRKQRQSQQRQGFQYDDYREASQVTATTPSQSLLQSSQLSVLMDAAEIMAGLEGRQHTIDGLPIPESCGLMEESQASTNSTRTSTRIAASKAAAAATIDTTTITSVAIVPKTVISVKPSIKGCTATRSLLSRGTTTRRISSKKLLVAKPERAQDTIHVKATPTSMIIRLPNSQNNKNKKRKEPSSSSVLQPNSNTKKMTSFKSARNGGGKALTPQKKRKLQRERERRSAHEEAQQAAQLAAQTIASPEVAKNLLLSMALVRINPRAAPSEWPERGAVITDGFFWGTYPPLETILRSHMREYYELSTTKCQSKLQQQFNNSLTIDIRAESENYGWDFAPNFDDKVLRDRIRCFFKTHIQNAKKRLRTMLKNPTKKANAKALVAHLALIERYSKEDDAHKPIYNPVIGDLVKVDVPDNVDETTMRKIKKEDDDDDGSDTKQVLSLGFQNLSQDEKIKEQQSAYRV
eukprot:CAMPEP_0119010220 /NCGR_PEP_ID=MMETSP1176-20130426/4867_1 /TAXON_ID=265551 /ORGANISM="Synedropsis recta cf, Strain CCMP1620" /LENGTH=598 /DNA_ID=CAMNT_0006962847 /DNA_START=83 /DNA_END=1879 /DNA_ORIENTATION=+